MKTNKVPLIIMSIFAVVGLGMLIGGSALLMNGLKFKQTADKVYATISNIESYRDFDGDLQHQVIVSYIVNGKLYSVSLHEYSSSMYEGKEILILYDPEDPAYIMTTTGMYIAPAILLIMGVIFFLAGTIPTIVMIKNNVNDKKLLTSGRVLHATVEEITLNTSYSVNDRHPYILYCTYRDDYLDRTYRFKSDNLWTNPESVLAPGSYIDVYVNPDDYSRYHVDVEAAVSGRIIDFT